MKTAIATISILIFLFVTAPIFYYLMHWVLVQEHAGDIQMFLFWVYAPLTMLVTVSIKILEAVK